MKKSRNTREILKNSKIIATHSTADVVQDQVKSTTWVNKLYSNTVSAMSEVLKTLEDGPSPASSSSSSSSSEKGESEGVEKTVLVVLSDGSSPGLNQARKYFENKSAVETCNVSELEPTLAKLDPSKLLYVHAFLVSKEDTIKFSNAIVECEFNKTINLINHHNAFDEISSLSKLQSHVADIKCISSGVKHNVAASDYLFLNTYSAYDRQAAYILQFYSPSEDAPDLFN
jgi:hypothetical protein